MSRKKYEYETVILAFQQLKIRAKNKKMKKKLQSNILL